MRLIGNHFHIRAVNKIKQLHCNLVFGILFWQFFDHNTNQLDQGLSRLWFVNYVFGLVLETTFVQIHMQPRQLIKVTHDRLEPRRQVSREHCECVCIEVVV
jgi:hypothetical protein